MAQRRGTWRRWPPSLNAFWTSRCARVVWLMTPCSELCEVSETKGKTSAGGTHIGTPFSWPHFVIAASNFVYLSLPNVFCKKSARSTLGASSGRISRVMRRKGRCSSSNWRGRWRTSWEYAMASSSSCWPMQQLTQPWGRERGR